MSETDTVTSQEPTTAATTADSATQVVDAGTSDSGSQVSTSTGADSAAVTATPDAQTNAVPGSLTARTDTPTTQTPSSAPTAVPAGFVPQKDLDNLKRELSKRSNDLRSVQQKYQAYDGIDPATVQAWRKQQEEAKQAKLPLWNAKNPENPRFGELKARWQQANANYQRLSQGKTPEEQAALRADLLADFSPQDQQAMREHGQHKARFTERMAEDPEGTLADMLDARLESKLQEREQRFQAKQSAEQNVGHWFQEQANAPVVESQGEWMEQALTQGVPWTVVRLEAENRHLRSQLGQGFVKVQAAEERTRLAKGKASVSRDPVTTPISDPFDSLVKLARERNVQVGGKGWLDLIAENPHLTQ